MRGNRGLGRAGLAVSTPRRAMSIAVLACVLGAALALLAASRTWAVEVVAQAAPQPPLHTPRTGSSLEPWLSALALVGLAGAGALLATRGRGRTFVGVLVLMAALGVLAGGVDGLAGTAGIRPIWPVLAMLGGLLIGYTGLLAVFRAQHWPAMGTRYERPVSVRVDQPQHTGPSRSDVAMWDALDRGEDPTGRSS